MNASLALLVLVALAAAALACAWRAVAHARTPQGAVGWVVFLIAAPYAAVPAYLFLGHHRYRGHLVSRHTSAVVIDRIRRRASAAAPADTPAVHPRPFERIAQLPVLRGNAVHALIDGAETFGAVFAAIDEARDYVLAQFFIVHDDALGRAFRDRLVAAAGRGVDVRLMIDEIGSHRLPGAYVAGLRAAGVRVASSGRRGWLARRLQINYRNHRKTVVVDGRIGFTGGLNVGDEYMGRDPDFGPWLNAPSTA